jgi:hypothetical protein
VADESENSCDLGAASGQSRKLDVIELIPGEHYLVFFDASPADLPDEDTIAELRLLAGIARHSSVLGATEQAVEAVTMTLAVAASANVISDIWWNRFQAAGRFAQRWRERRKSAAPVTAEEAVKLVTQATESGALPVAAPASETDITLTTPGGGAVKISIRTPAARVRIRVETTGSIADVTIDG